MGFNLKMSFVFLPCFRDDVVTNSCDFGVGFVNDAIILGPFEIIDEISLKVDFALHDFDEHTFSNRTPECVWMT